MENLIRIVKQEHKTGCGVACVAICLGWSYPEAFEKFKKVLNWGSRKSVFYTKAPELARVLESEGIPHDVLRSGRWENIEGTAIVGVNRKSGYWHWVVAVKDADRFFIVDPELGEIYQHQNWPHDYKCGPRNSYYIRLGDAARCVSI
ncbi:hypothetical protein [Franzmannia qiaohouensis]|uniref:Peptidase C39 domain-containing protein n=1 Tax=Franzmannia qiaohouensis TaxID=1329370 RepID=A0ABU1HJD3_9GAMM|nr:hypothetical protein [Halomonas qiaohouensis]MDR5907597.1 hypothetical protein [Halomonas qiaohouensis]